MSPHATPTAVKETVGLFSFSELIDCRPDAG